MKQVSERVGYPNLYYFSRIFKQITGVMASEYKLQ
jgi:YesN/AraC family two-component response regulator